MNECCDACGANIAYVDIALSRKLVNRGTAVFWCRACLAQRLRTTPDALDKMAEYFRKTGCTLFE